MEQTDYGTDDPLWIDNAYLDTIVTAGLTLFVLCLMKLSKVNLYIIHPVKYWHVTILCNHYSYISTIVSFSFV